MNEAFLHYLWEHRLFNTNKLKSDDGQQIEIVNTGTHNHYAGPDFFHAQIRIDGTLWAGNVEIHIQSSDWRRHNHHLDPAYENCILHVVHANDCPTHRMNGSIIPTIQLKGRFPPHLWDNYLRLINQRGWIPCQGRLIEVTEETWRRTYEMMIAERLESKAASMLEALTLHKGDWEECLYQFLFRNFGFQVNTVPFELLTRSLPLRFLKKERNIAGHIEAMLFGQSGLLHEQLYDAYPRTLWQSYTHLQKKYSLKPLDVSVWKLMRLRPSNFPILRLAQLASLIGSLDSLLKLVDDSQSVREIRSMMAVDTPSYWENHYHFDVITRHSAKSLGRQSIDNIIINAIAPFHYARGIYFDDSWEKERALAILDELSPETNNLIKRWKELGVHPLSARQSQALLQLRNEHCSRKKCLTCPVGNSLINILP